MDDNASANKSSSSIGKNDDKSLEKMISFYESTIEQRKQRLDRILKASKTSEKWIILLPVMLICLFISNTFYHAGLSGVLVPVSVPLLYIVFYFWKGFKKEYFSLSSTFMLVMILILCSGFVINDDTLTNIVTFLTLAVCIPLQLRLSTQHDTLSDFNIITRSIKTIFTDAFLVIPESAKVMVTDKTKDKKLLKIVYVLAGVACTIPFFIILSVLFANGDDMFRLSVTKFFSAFSGINSFSVIFTIVVGLVLCVYFTALFIRLKSDEQIVDVRKSEFRKLNSIAVTTFLIILIALELFFSFIQIKYLFLNAGMLAEGESFADYARGGFFEISAATLLTIAIIFAVSVLTQKNEKGKLPLVIRVLLSVFSLCVCITFSSAYYRMMIYINAYSLTVKRVAVCWLMALMLLILIGIVFSFWIEKFQLMKFITYSVMISVIALNLLSVQSFVAKNNVNRYLEDSKNYVLDVEYIAQLEPGSTPQLEKLYNTPSIRNTPVYDNVCGKLYNMYQSSMSYSWMDSNIPNCRSRKIINSMFFDEKGYYTGVKTYYTDQNNNSNYNGEEILSEPSYEDVKSAYDRLPEG